MPAGQSATGGSAVGSKYRLEVKPLRCLRAPQRGAVDRLPNRSILDALDRISQRRARDRRDSPV